MARPRTGTSYLLVPEKQWPLWKFSSRFRRDLAMAGCKWMIFNDFSEMSVLLCLVIFCWFEVCHLPYCFQSACISHQDAIPDPLRSPAPVTCKLCGLWCHSSMTTADMWGAEVQWLPSNWKTIQDDSPLVKWGWIHTYGRHRNIFIVIYIYIYMYMYIYIYILKYHILVVWTSISHRDSTGELTADPGPSGTTRTKTWGISWCATAKPSRRSWDRLGKMVV